MAYTKLGLMDGQTFTAQHLSHIESGIETVSNESAALTTSVEGMAADVESVESSVNALSGKQTTVYCWGDSLTEGVGGWLPTTDTVQKLIVSAYPDVVGTTYNAVNLGCRTDTIQTIMARQGADPMVVGGFTIPAGTEESVVIGYMRGAWYDDNALGITTQAGQLAQPMRESEAGINPCYIAGVKGQMCRSLTADSEGRYAYSFKRQEAGEAVQVPAGTVLETHAMRYYRNGTAVIWMGANGYAANLDTYISYLQKMIDYGQYDNYLILIAREHVEASIAQIKAEFTDADGTCHVLALIPPLLDRGYTLSGIAPTAGYPDTSSWTTTDPLKKQCPLLNASTGIAEENFETLHFSAYGYRAIGKLVVEKLGELLYKASTSGGGTGGGSGSGSGSGEAETDEFGTLAYHLTTPVVFDGTKAAVNTRWAPYDTEKDWTIAIKYSDDIDHLTNRYNVSLCNMSGDEPNLWLFVNKYDGYPSTDVLFAVGNGSFEYHQAGHGNTPSSDGYHYAIVSKSGNMVSHFVDGYLAGTQEREFAATKTQKLYIGGTAGEAGLTGTIAEVRIYETALDTDSCKELTMAMQA